MILILLSALLEVRGIRYEPNQKVPQIGRRERYFNRNLHEQNVPQTSRIIVDGSYEPINNNASVGQVIFYQFNHKVLQGATTVFAASSIQSEALACFRGLQEAVKLQLRRVAVVTDNSLILDYLNVPEQAQVEIISILQELHAHLYSFQEVLVIKLDRYQVPLAHDLAVQARSIL